jgi:hypothetical protein
MTNPRLTFGEMTVFGELARGVHPADETGVAMALALGQPDPPYPPFATVPVLLDGHEIGQVERVDFVWGGSCYGFSSLSGNTKFFCPTREELLQGLEDRLQLSS